MNTRKTNLLLSSLLVLLLAGSSLAASRGWTNNARAAAARAKKTGKPILANFTGSDWCGWCIKLKKEVFTTPEFAKWAKENVVLLELDFPRRKKQASTLQKQNKALAEKYGIRGFPTILFLDEEGEVIGKTGYVEGGPGAWIEQAEKILSDYRASRLAMPAESIGEALKTARAETKPLLVVTAPNTALAKRQQSQLFTHKDFIALANSRLVLAHANKYAKSWTREDVEALEQLHKDLGIKGEPRYLLVDLASENPGPKVLFQETKSLKPEQLVEAIQQKLPEISHNGGWLEDFAKAQAIATQENRPMLLDFTGSDWCGWCIKLDKEVFSQPDFEEYAAKNLVLVKLDFPKRKKLPAEVEQQNKRLAQKYGIRGFPTIIILDPSGKQIGKMGYQKGGPGPFIDGLKKIIKPGT